MRHPGVHVVLALILTAACGEGSAKPSVTTAEDREVKSAMDACMSEIMRVVAQTSEVDTASQEALNIATRTTLLACADQSVAEAGLSASHHCTTEGCYGTDGFGYSWETVALDWAEDRIGGG